MPEIIDAGSIQLDKPTAPQVVDAGSIHLDENPAGQLGTGNIVRTSRALIETGMAAFSGLYAWPAGKVAGVVTHLLTGDIDAAKAVDEGVNNELMVKPKTTEGEYITNNLFRLVGAPFEMMSEVARTGGQMVKESPVGGLLPEKDVTDYYADIAGVLATGGAAKGLMKIARDGVPKGGETVPEFLKEVTGRGPVAEEARIKIETEKIAAREEAAKAAEAMPEAPVVEASARREIVQPGETSGARKPNTGEMYWPESDEAHFAFSEMKSQLANAETKTVTEVNGETFVAGSGYPQWFRDISRKHKISAKETTGIIDKYLSSKAPLTDRQANIFDDIIHAARKEAEPYARFQAEIDALAKEGIDAGAIQANRKSLISDLAAEDGAKEGLFTEAEIAAALEDFFQEKADIAAFKGKIETGDLAGLSASETFSLANPETEIARGGVSKKDMTPTGSIFNERGAIPLREKEVPLLHEFPKPINDRYKAAIPKDPTLFQKGADLLETLKNKLTREFENLPKTEEFAELRFELLNLSKYKGIASDRATRALEEIVTTLDKPTMDLFEKKVILDDLFYSAEREMDLPFGFTKESLATEKIIVDDLVSKNPKVAESIARRKALWEEIRENYTDAMDSIGMDVSERFKNPDYYHHQVLEYAQAKNILGAGKKLSTPSGRGFLKKRAGSEMDINRDYLQVEHDVMAQMIHDVKVAEVIRTVDERYNIAQMLRDEAKKQGVEDWKTTIPDGYDLWQPREGQVFYMSQSVPAKISDALLSGALEEYGITAADLKGIMVVGGKRKEFVLKKEIIETLDNLTKVDHNNAVSKGSAWLMRQWKEKVALLNPKGLFKYNARNISGDAEGVFVGNPAAFAKSPAAFRELYNAFYGDGKMTKTLSDFFEMGGFESTLQAMEINKFGDLKAFSHLREKGGNLLTAPRDVWNWYWKNAQVATSVREATLRYASYLDYLEQMKRSPNGMPENFGASIPDEIVGLSTPEKRAYWLQNDLLGAYDRVGIIGQELREHIWPFWSWKEVNFKRYVNLWNNAAGSAEIATKIGKTLGANAPFVAYKVGSLAVKITGLMAMLEVYNNTFFKDEEDSLPDNVKRSAHVVFGKDSEGKVIYFDRLGMFSDFLSNFGLDGAHRLVPEVLAGRMTVKEMAKEIVKGPLNVVVNGVSPYFKWPAELLTSRKTYPDVTRPSTIRDKKLYIADQLKLGDEYRALMSLPSEGYEKSIKRFFAYSSDPGQAAYFDIMDDKRRFAERNGKEGEGFFITPKGNALFNYRMSLKYKDIKSAERYIDEYLALGGTPQGLMASLQAMNPLSGLNAMEKAQFVSEMDEKTFGKFEKAMTYYMDQLMQ